MEELGIPKVNISYNFLTIKRDVNSLNMQNTLPWQKNSKLASVNINEVLFSCYEFDQKMLPWISHSLLINIKEKKI